MKLILKSIYSVLAGVALVAAGGCSDDRNTTLALDGDTAIEAITVSAWPGTVDQKAKTVTVNLPVDVDLTALRVDAITLSPGASCDYPAGTVFDGTMPRSIRVTNGNVFTDYAMTACHDDVQLFSFTLDGTYQGTIDNSARTVLVFVPLEADVTAMRAAFTVNEGTTVTPASESVLDFTTPVRFTAVNRTATIEYTVTVIKDEMSQAPKAFVGNASSVDALGDEAKAACRWMLDNVPNSRYISLQQIIDGEAHLDDYTMLWCHFDWLDWPSQMWDTRDIFNSYWLHGGAILASRDGARYINDVWRIARDQQSPNNMFGGETAETLKTPMGFTVTGHEDHALFAGLTPDADGRILLLNTGCSSTGRTLQWGADWDPYGSMAGWESRTGAKALASGHDYDINRVTIAEFEPWEALAGFTSGRVITIGTPAYEWYDRNDAANPYRENLVTLTKNAINYLCK